MTKVSIDLHVVVPSVWPMGCGNVITGQVIEPDLKGLLLRAVPDEYKGEPGTPVSDDKWEQIAAMDPPTLLITFATPESVDGMIETLTKVRASFEG